MGIVRQIMRDTSGANMTEYALLIAFIAIVVAVALPALRTAVGGVFTRVGTILGN